MILIFSSKTAFEQFIIIQLNSVSPVLLGACVHFWKSLSNLFSIDSFSSDQRLISVSLSLNAELEVGVKVDTFAVAAAVATFDQSNDWSK